MLTYPHTTDEVIPLDVEANDVDTTSYSAKIVVAGALAPTAAEIITPAEIDGTIVGVRATTLAAGLYDIYVKVGAGIIRGPIKLRLTP